MADAYNRRITIPGGIWEYKDLDLYVQFSSDSHYLEKCEHTHTVQGKEGWLEWPLVLIGRNEGGYNSVGICVLCVLHHLDDCKDCDDPNCKKCRNHITK